MTKVFAAVLLVLLACSSLETTAQATDIVYPPDVTVKYWFAVARGGISGMEKGLYKKSTYVVNAQCLGNGTLNDTVQIYNMYFNNDTSKDWWGMMTRVQRIMHIQNKFCDFDDVINDLFKWCDNNDCTVEYLLQNVLKKVIQITTVATNISTILADTTPQPAITNTAYYFTRWENIFTQAGNLMRYLTDFDAAKVVNY